MALTKVRNRMVDFGGGIYLGGTAAANKLDDYEEGTWTPTIGGMGSVTYVEQWGKYTKVGRLVTLAGKLSVTNNTRGASAVYIASLPFASADSSDSNQRTAAYPEGDYVGVKTFLDSFGHFRSAGTTLLAVRDNGSGQTIVGYANTFSAACEFNFNIYYYV